LLCLCDTLIDGDVSCQMSVLPCPSNDKSVID